MKLGVLFDASFAGSVKLELDTPNLIVKLELDTPNLIAKLELDTVSVSSLHT